MRIIIEPTSTQDQMDKIMALTNNAMSINHRVVIEHPYDDLSMEHVADLVRSALVAYGFSEETVNEYLNGHE